MALPEMSFKPDYAPKAPGEHLRLFLEARGIKIVDFARRTGRPTKTISEIISGKVSITPETALQFERVLGESASFWLGLETKHQLAVARSKEISMSSRSEAVAWAKKFPINEMVKLNFFKKKPSLDALVDSILRAFGVSSISAWDEHWQKRLNLSRFKQQNHYKVDPFSVAVWLRKSEIVAEAIDTEVYSEAGFKALIPDLRSLSLQPWNEIESTLVEECAKVGVALVLVPTVPNTGLRGAAYWATKDKAVIVVSDRLKHEANVWFSFFHEVCHILEHSKKAVFIDHHDEGTGGRDIEAEADEFSAETLIPKSVLGAFVQRYGQYVPKMSPAVFKSFAKEYNVAPGLLLMRLQHHKVLPRKTPLAKLKRKLEFTGK